MSAHRTRTYKQALFDEGFYYLPKAKFYADDDDATRGEDDFENPMRAEVSYADGAHDDSPYSALVISDWGNRLDVILAETHADADNAGKALMEKIAKETGDSIEEHDLSYYVFERD